MIHSMTGFGKSSAKSKYGSITVEIRSLNHKFFEPSIKLPNGLAGFEDRVKKILQKYVKRGKVYINVNMDDGLKAMDKISIDIDTARAYRKQISSLKKTLNLKGDVAVEQFVTLPGVITYETPKIDAIKVWPTVRKAFTLALAQLVKDREKEGKAISLDVSGRARTISSLIKNVNQRSGISVTNYKKRLAKKIKELTKSQQIDKQRLEQEVAIFAKNCDISEELMRIETHVSAFKESLKNDAEVGKKLDFIAQELHREINTIGSKASDSKISRWVIQIKGEVEKIREQVKNIQ